MPKASVLVGRLPAKRGLEVGAKRYEPPLKGDEVVEAGARVMDMSRLRTHGTLYRWC